MTNKENLASVVKKATAQLASAGIENPLLNVRHLVAHALDIEVDRALEEPDRILTEKEARLIETLVDRRARRETYARIIGEVEFCGLMFGINEATLEPRPDSEVLVRTVVERKRPPSWRIFDRQPLRILDLGTGSGCLLLSILKCLPNATGVGIDIAPRAVEQAKQNASRLKLESRSDFKINDWDEGIDEQFDVIVSNPPYIPQDEIPKLIPAVRDHDPVLALDGGKDGLDKYRYLIPRLSNLLKKGGMVALEVGYGQAKAVKSLLERSGFTSIAIHKDPAGIERCLEAHRPL